MGSNVKQTGLDQGLKIVFTGQGSWVISDLKAGWWSGFNWIKGEIKDSLNQIMKEVKEVNRDGRAIKGSQIQMSEENIEMINCSRQSVLKQILK